MLESGYFQLGRWRGVPLRIHLLAPLGALLFTGFRFAPGAWLGFLLLILIHEMGHALAVMRYGLRVSSIDLHLYGGVCRWSGQATQWQRSVIAWGGVMAQALLLVLTWVIGGSVHSMFGREMAYVFTSTNLWLMAINLLPFPPFDGAEAWKIVRELRGRRSRKAVLGDSEWRGYVDVKKSSRRPPEVSSDDARRIARAFEDAVRKR
jgi:Zn-dependent protease